MREFEVIVIGGGSAGYAAARTAQTAGATVAVIEGGVKVGGLCILRGCMPTKALLESSHRWKMIQEAKEFGLDARPVGIDFKAIMARKDRLVGEFADYRRDQLEKGDFTFLRGQARFLDAHRIELTTPAGVEVLRGKSFIIATGSKVHELPISGLKEAGSLTSDTALENRKLPQSIVILGGGAIAVEFAQFYGNLGVKTTVIQRNAHLIKEFDPEVSETLAAVFCEQGITVFTGTQLLKVSQSQRGKVVSFEHQGKKKRVVAEEIFYALGREPATRELSLEKAGVALNQGAIRVNKELRTSQPHVFAAGDVTGLYDVVHTAIYQAEIAGANAARVALGKKSAPKKADYRLKTLVIFTEPEVASVGLSEHEALQAGLEVYTASFPFADHGKSMIMGVKHGFVKLIAEKKKGKILGAQIVGPHASDLIHEIIAIMRFSGTAADLATMPHYHPTLAEILTYPAEEIAEKVLKAR